MPELSRIILSAVSTPPPLVLCETIWSYCNYDFLANLEILGCSGAKIKKKCQSVNKCLSLRCIKEGEICKHFLRFCLGTPKAQSPSRIVSPCLQFALPLDAGAVRAEITF